MSRFRVGDVCVGHSFVYCVECNGMECVVIDFDPAKCGIGNPSGIPYGPQPMWRVAWANGDKSWQDERNLRLRRPPSWDAWLYDTKDVERENSQPQREVSP